MQSIWADLENVSNLFIKTQRPRGLKEPADNLAAIMPAGHGDLVVGVVITFSWLCH